MSTRAPFMLAVVPAADAAPAEKPKPSLFTDYLDIGVLLSAPPPDLDFVLPGLLAGTLGMLVSAGGTGKSMLALEWAISLALGEDKWRTLGADPTPRRVLMVNAEDPSPIIARRLHTLVGGEPGLLEPLRENLRVKSVLGAGWSFGSVMRGRFIPSNALETLAAEIQEWRPSLVIVDTLNRALAGLDENDNATMGAVVSVLERILTPSNAAGLVLHHTSKMASLNGLGDRQEAARGAGALTANARFAQNLVGMDAKEAKARGILEERRFHFVRMPSPKANYCPPIEERLLWRRPDGVLVGEPRDADIPDDWKVPEWVKKVEAEKTKPTKKKGRANDAA